MGIGSSRRLSGVVGLPFSSRSKEAGNAQLFTCELMTLSNLLSPVVDLIERHKQLWLHIDVQPLHFGLSALTHSEFRFGCLEIVIVETLN